MAEQLFQIGIKALARNKANEILMVHIPERSGSPAYWDLPGGRMNNGEGFLQTLERELLEEIGVAYVGRPKQLTSTLTNITIPVGDVRYPLMLIVYEVALPDGYQIRLDPDSPEDKYGWFASDQAARHMAVKFSDEFCDMIRSSGASSAEN